MEDYGIVDVTLKGSGLSIWINWRLISEPGVPARVKLENVRSTLDTVLIHFEKAHHS